MTSMLLEGLTFKFEKALPFLGEKQTKIWRQGPVAKLKLVANCQSFCPQPPKCEDLVVGVCLCAWLQFFSFITSLQAITHTYVHTP